MTRGFCIYCGEPGGPVCGRCEYDEHDAADPIAEFRELGERIEREATAKTEAELRSTMKMQRRVAWAGR